MLPLKRSLVALVFLLGTLPAAEFKSPLAALELKDGDSLVFLGDSITHQCLYTQYVEDYFYTRFPRVRLKIHNAGVGGARAKDALLRFDRDVAAYKPRYVTILLGMNDGTYRPYDEETFQTYRRDMRELIDKIVSIGATPILMTPTMYDSRAARVIGESNPMRASPPERLELYNSVLAYYGAWLREVAVEGGHGFVDMYSPLNNITLAQRKQSPGFTLIKDAVHPDAPGQVVMAVALVDGLGLPRQVSRIRISRDAAGQPNSDVVGGTLSGLKVSDEQIEFTWTAESLPWVVPAEAQLGARLTSLGHRLSQERLELHGVPQGRYDLLIDDAVIGTFSTEELARHIELQANERTPQHQQSAKIAELNRDRNNGPVKVLRAEWLLFQQYARVKLISESQPDNAQLKQQLADLEKKLEGREERIQKAEADAKVYEDKIFETNVIPARKYVLKRVAAET